MCTYARVVDMLVNRLLLSLEYLCTNACLLDGSEDDHVGLSCGQSSISSSTCPARRPRPLDVT